jgi:hypothetical protein
MSWKEVHEEMEKIEQIVESMETSEQEKMEEGNNIIAGEKVLIESENPVPNPVVHPDPDVLGARPKDTQVQIHEKDVKMPSSASSTSTKR